MKLVPSDGCEDGFKVFFRLNQGIGGSQLGEEMRIGVSDQREPEGLGDCHGFEVKVDLLGIKMAIFYGVKKLQMLQEISV